MLDSVKNFLGYKSVPTLANPINPDSVAGRLANENIKAGKNEGPFRNVLSQNKGLVITATIIAVGAAVAAVFGVMSGTIAMYASAAAAGGAVLLGSIAFLVKKIVDEHKLEKASKEFYEAIKDYDTHLKGDSNAKATAEERYKNAKDNLIKILHERNPDNLDKFVGRVSKAADHNPNFRINATDKRYGFLVKGNSESMIFKDFVAALVGDQKDQIASKYEDSLIEVAQTIKDHARDLNQAPLLEKALNEAKKEIFSNPDFKLLHKGREEVLADLSKALVDQIGGEKKVKAMISDLENKSQDKVNFWNHLSNDTDLLDKEYSKLTNQRDGDIYAFDTEISDLEDKLKEYNTKIISYREIYDDKKEFQENRDIAKAKIDELLKRIDEINSRKEEIQIEKEKLGVEKLEKEGALADEYLDKIREKREFLGFLIGKNDLENLKRPEKPTFGEKAKHTAKNLAKVAVGLAVVGGAAYAADRYLDGKGMNAIGNFAKDGYNKLKDGYNKLHAHLYGQPIKPVAVVK